MTITFKNGGNQVKRVAVAFTRSSSNQYISNGYATAAGLAVLSGMNNVGNRWYWDRVYIENRGGSTPLNIRLLNAYITYPISGTFLNRINLLSGYVNKVLDDGYDIISLNGLKRGGAISTAHITSATFNSYPLHLRKALLDLGKTGSDGRHSIFEINPKYNPANSHLCSEFVSWYLYNCGVTISGSSYSFRDTTSTMTVYKKFKKAGKLYSYHNGKQKWVKHGTTSIYYQPKPGDYLIRLKNTAENISEHSMMIIDWNKTTKVARVVNGPWPVTIRTLNIQDWERNHEHDYAVGRL